MVAAAVARLAARQGALARHILTTAPCGPTRPLRLLSPSDSQQADHTEMHAYASSCTRCLPAGADPSLKKDAVRRHEVRSLLEEVTKEKVRWPNSAWGGALAPDPPLLAADGPGQGRGDGEGGSSSGLDPSVRV